MPTEKRPRGRPTDLDKVVGQREENTPSGVRVVDVTVADRIIAAVRAGNYLETAASSAGVAPNTVRQWLRDGQQTLRTPGRRTRYQALAAEFSEAFVRAQGESEAEDVAQLARLARGGLRLVTVTERTDAKGEVVKTVKTEDTLPDAQVLEWRLERRFRERWGRQIEVTGAGGGPMQVDVTDVRERIAGRLDLIGDRLAGAIILPPSAVHELTEPGAEVVLPDPESV